MTTRETNGAGRPAIPAAPGRHADADAPDTFRLSDYGTTDDAFRAAREHAETLCADGTIGAGWRIVGLCVLTFPGFVPAWRIVAPNGDRFAALWGGER